MTTEQRIVFGREAGDSLDACLTALCGRGLVVTITLSNGDTIGGVLLASTPEHVELDRWNTEGQYPSGQRLTLSVRDIAQIRVD
ncbi:MAG: hypothetical protein M0Z95_29655 [Actinomycetota bacterium]|nr:hypothetical protein [Actinomycetota bacterium]